MAAPICVIAPFPELADLARLVNDVLRGLTALPRGFQGKVAIVRFHHTFEEACQLGQVGLPVGWPWARRRCGG